MIYPKAFLVSVLNDAICSYELSVKKMHPERKLQIDIVRRMCDSAQHDVMIISFLRGLCIKMNQQTPWVAWMSGQRSRLSTIIEECISSYKYTVEIWHSQQYQKKGEAVQGHQLEFAKKKAILQSLPDFVEIAEDRSKLLALEV